MQRIRRRRPLLPGQRRPLQFIPGNSAHRTSIIFSRLISVVIMNAYFFGRHPEHSEGPLYFVVACSCPSNASFEKLSVQKHTP
jgi:hypothetical protein